MSAAQHGYKSISHTLYQNGVSISAGETRLPISSNIPVSDESSLHFSIFIDVTNVSLGVDEEIKIYLQKFINNEWYDVGDPQAVVSINDGDGLYCIKLTGHIELEAMVLPLPSIVRLSAESGPGSTAKVTNVITYSRI